WPGGAPPDLLWGSLNAVLIVLSAIPNVYTDKAAIDQDLGKVRFWLVILCLFGLALLVVRFLEFTTLNVRGDENAYGSVVWMLLGLHTFNLVTDYGDTLVLTVLMHKGSLEG